MFVNNFNFELPKSLIAHFPLKKRRNCKLLFLNGLSGSVTHGVFSNILDNIQKGDLLVLNNTRVIPARIFGHKKLTGGKVELLIERILNSNCVLAHVRSSKEIKPGTELQLGDNRDVKAILIMRHNKFFKIIFEDNRNIIDIINDIGHVPLPPYINRLDDDIDVKLYQTVYGTCPGAIAAPTAGLHFDNFLLHKLRKKGVDIAFVTLHIGSGTFQPIHVEKIADHYMHPEYVEVSEKVVNAVINCKNNGKKVIAVGTTSVRSLESAAKTNKQKIISPFFDYTNIFIYPGYKYKITDAMITNFHTPKSTLIMLVCAFGGYHHTMRAYQIAIAEKYSFLSYGDAMFVTKNPNAPKEISGI
ncbi:tRNA preQ1(34) S-adenosylmethionine ribosyltransferase-isomerase QueA [Candidatus Pantoea edessiphila]|uniref:S-adenosylmethionine:tRNA ribosyltransferase-isomerase n=1 Tax=Candidatus Pantoea edessiphila TaxID=2044610 RepID=A0A2P5SZF7_9GAMM|nr:tRNA preQ1(34) S-adenosylmethionine ribosyltransferase-isomerase QueA [Candidatus Pantoea edessiphila]PPI87721.1 tRNA preQ1(34) S-adenosylmethionine ribosyltransferase-isomerase QueA [Candidatus Pantoea edessiphila]